MNSRFVSRLAVLLAGAGASCASADSFVWTGSQSAQWFVANNWVNQTLGGVPGIPGPGDSVNLAYSTVQLDGNAVVGSVSGNGVVIVNGSLSGDAAANCSIVLNAGLIDIPVMNGVSLTLNAGDLGGQPELSSCVIGLNSAGHVDAILTGSCTAYGHVRAGQRLIARAIGTNSALLYFPSPLTNSGSIVLEGDLSAESRLRCDYPITNNGAIDFQAQSGVLQAPLENSGVVSVSGGAIFASYGAVYRNSGTLTIAPSGWLQVFGSAQTFVQESGSFAGSQRSSFSNMSLRYTGGTFELQGGLATGPRLYNCILENYAAGSVSFDAMGSTTMYGHVQAGQEVISRNWNGEGTSQLYFPGPVTNAGRIVIDSQLGATAGMLRTDYSMTNSGVIELTGEGTRQLVGSLVNSGTFTVDAPTTFSSYGAVYSNAGQLVLHDSLGIVGLAQTFRQLSGRVENAHRLTMSNMSVSFEGGAFEAGPGHAFAPSIYDCVFSNQCDLPLALDARGTTTFYGNIAAQQTIRCAEIPGASDPYLYFPGPISNAGEITLTSDAARSATLRTDYSLTNTGTVRIEPGGGGSRLCFGSLVNEGLYLINAPTTFSMYGAVYRNRGFLTIDPAQTLSISGLAQTLVQENGTLENASRISLNAMSFTYSGGTIGAEGGAPSGPRLTDCTLSLAAAGPLDLECARTTTIYGDIAPEQTLRILNTDATDSAYAYFPGPVTNAGRIVISSRNAAAPATLRTDYTLHNATGGTVEFLAGAGGPRTFVGSLINHGLWSVQASTSAILYGAQFTNYGFFDVADGSAFWIGGLPQTFVQASPGIITGGRNIKASAGVAFHYLGGQFADQGPELTNCSVNFGTEATQPIDLLLHGTTTFYGVILPGHTIASVATPGEGSLLYFPGPITNQGQITLTTPVSDQTSRLRCDYPFVNAGGLHLDPGGSVEGSTFVQGSAGTTHFVLKGIEPNEFGRIQVSGTATIDGTITNQTVPGYTTYDQDHWDVIVAPGGLVGTYATEAINPGFSFRYESQVGRLVFLRCAADYNLDGGVDGGDVDAFFFDWERGVLSADVNADGGVDGSDVTYFFEAWESGGCV